MDSVYQTNSIAQTLAWHSSLHFHLYLLYPVWTYFTSVFYVIISSLSGTKVSLHSIYLNSLMDVIRPLINILKEVNCNYMCVCLCYCVFHEKLHIISFVTLFINTGIIEQFILVVIKGCSHFMAI